MLVVYRQSTHAS